MSDDTVNMTSYFWSEKGDLERCSSWDKMKVELEREAPEVVRAWENYKIAISTMNAVVKQLVDNHEYV